MIVVIGSINTDLITTCEHFPKVGETIIGSDFKTLPGGKGANQAVCAAKLGEKVSFIGCLGNDSNGGFSLENFALNNINTDGIEIIENIPSGVAQITVAENDNSIIVVPGANAELTKDVVDKNMSILEKAKIVLLQLEVPVETVEYVINICNDKGIKVILNPAPAQKLNDNIIEKVDYLTPNETELEIIFEKDKESILKQYPNKVIMTAGGDGVFYHDGESLINIPSEKVNVVDTTGAGDTFNGALAVGIINGIELEQSIRNANKIASLAVQELGAQTAMPHDYKVII
ncbi:ribokinase [Mycoplasmatota bacterium WC44]